MKGGKGAERDSQLHRTNHQEWCLINSKGNKRALQPIFLRKHALSPLFCNPTPFRSSVRANERPKLDWSVIKSVLAVLPVNVGVMTQFCNQTHRVAASGSVYFTLRTLWPVKAWIQSYTHLCWCNEWSLPRRKFYSLFPCFGFFPLHPTPTRQVLLSTRGLLNTTFVSSVISLSGAAKFWDFSAKTQSKQTFASTCARAHTHTHAHALSQ